MPHEPYKYHSNELYTQILTSCHLLLLVTVIRRHVQYMILKGFQILTENFLLINDIRGACKERLEKMGIPCDRYSVYNKVNYSGRMLTEFCHCHDLKTVNGWVGEDKFVGAATCDDASETYYIICSPSTFSNLQILNMINMIHCSSTDIIRFWLKLP